MEVVGERVPDTRRIVCSGIIPLPATARDQVHTSRNTGSSIFALRRLQIVHFPQAKNSSGSLPLDILHLPRTSNRTAREQTSTYPSFQTPEKQSVAEIFYTAAHLDNRVVVFREAAHPDNRVVVFRETACSTPTAGKISSKISTVNEALLAIREAACLGSSGSFSRTYRSRHGKQGLPQRVLDISLLSERSIGSVESPRISGRSGCKYTGNGSFFWNTLPASRTVVASRVAVTDRSNVFIPATLRIQTLVYQREASGSSIVDYRFWKTARTNAQEKAHTSCKPSMFFWKYSTSRKTPSPGK